MSPLHHALVIVFILGAVCTYDTISLSESIYQRRRHVPKQCNFYAREHGAARYAVVTLLTTSDYVRLASTLGKSLLLYSQLPCSIDRIALITAESKITGSKITELSDAGWEVRTIQTILSPEHINWNTVNTARYIPLLTKLHIFNMTQYEAVLFLDSDMIALGNIHVLFTDVLPEMKYRKMHMGWVRDQGGTFARTFNTGLLLVLPSTALFTDLMRFVRRGKYDTLFADQGVLNSYFGLTQYDIDGRFNVMTNIPQDNATLYDSIRDDVRIFHSTLKPTDPFYISQCIWMRAHDLCRAWKDLDSLDIKFRRAIN
ncbi:hypothetical protein GUITHDRAFT_78726 [Guillardia theta CCMP2712]|uniref:Uncharacterized protein n=1 Tax=Guillardia theta (strain CCMP2712) TaxID=905079 RepID=L1ILD8_GUITC|nr:hypothetical protein GUITHDRAFT_78726 [Guillardia theta CCMP2712]EKX36709.1 hypothetical protein GUITHDRAFT_78726 [Guillardia theta CCMP2712]|eukprot:XP_005823689.1 hypothetical protein GUITHDRAFT_78726 [Guillardia theta CCMP2712]